MLTIFTPTYNRAFSLRKFYDSLKRQTVKDFEWLVCDDGSTDNTSEVLSGCLLEGIVKMRVVYQANGGKHRAINNGVKQAQGDWFFIVDSDDSLLDDSVATVLQHLREIEENPQFAGIVGNRIYSNGKRIGGEVPYQVLDVDSVSLRQCYHMKGDLAEVWRTEILKQYPFPEYIGEKFISESIVWDEIAKKYILRYINCNIYVCDYLQDGLTCNIRRHHRMSPCGTMAVYSKQMHDKRYSIKARIIAAINYWRYTISYKGERKGHLRPTGWAYLFYLAGYCFFKKDVFTEKRSKYQKEK